MLAADEADGGGGHGVWVVVKIAGEKGGLLAGCRGCCYCCCCFVVVVAVAILANWPNSAREHTHTNTRPPAPQSAGFDASAPAV
jgi:hypothetical protein